MQHSAYDSSKKRLERTSLPAGDFPFASSRVATRITSLLKERIYLKGGPLHGSRSDTSLVSVGRRKAREAQRKKFLLQLCFLSLSLLLFSPVSLFADSESTVITEACIP